MNRLSTHFETQAHFNKLKLLCGSPLISVIYKGSITCLLFPQLCGLQLFIAKSTHPFYCFLSFNCSAHQSLILMAKRKCSNSPNHSHWSTVDLLEFIWPAFLMMLFFMFLSNGLSNTPLVIIILNGQSPLMVCFSFYNLFIFLILTHSF